MTGYIENRDRNGVTVRVHRTADGHPLWTEASCQCFGLDFRVHSTSICPNRLRLRLERERRRVFDSYTQELI